MEAHWEPLTRTCRVLVSPAHRFTTDTLLLADFAVPKRGETCADLGCGCGTIPLLWRARKEPGAVVGLELSEEAASLAEISVRENGFSDTIRIVRGNIRRAAECFEKASFDLVSCNPPYQVRGAGIPAESAERNRARFEETCTLEDVAKAARAMLRFGGRFCLCQRPERLADAVCTLRAQGLEPKRLRFVQPRADKAPRLFLLESRRGGRPGLRVLPPLYTESGSGGDSAEMERIYGDYRACRGQKEKEQWDDER